VFVAEALNRLTLAGFVTPSSFTALSGVEFEVTDLAGAVIGLAGHDTVLIDVDAAGYGWFLDKTPYDDKEFTTGETGDILIALDSSTAAGSIDLLSAVMHELGHILGYGHESDVSFMSDSLDPGTRFNLNSTDTNDVYSFEEELSDYQGKNQTGFLRKFNYRNYSIALYFAKIRYEENDDFMKDIFKEDKLQFLSIKFEDVFMYDL
jgi:hypothetical protein